MKTISKIIIFISVLAILNATYLSYFFIEKKFFPDKQSFCDINSTLSCSEVITSPYAQIFGLPICVFALIVYPILIYFAYQTLKKDNIKDYFYIISIVSAMWLIMNLVYIYNEFAFIKAFCLLCILCSFFITANFILSIFWYKNSKS